MRKASIYFIQAGEDGPIKIGWAVNPEARMRTFQTANFLPLRMLFSERYRSILFAKAIESDLHTEFKDYRIHGEWFAPESRLIRAISDFCSGVPILMYMREHQSTKLAVRKFAESIVG